MPSRKYTPEQGKVLLAFLPGFVATEPNTRERKLWKANLNVEWLTRWDMKPEHPGMFSTWFRNHREELLQRQAQASTATRSASIEAVTVRASASVEDAHTASLTPFDAVQASSLDAEPARASTGTQSASIDAVTARASASVEDTHTASHT
ncbi:hypothetical protein EYR36_003214 [Pleurotus pulmonarius]|nr:hypothetical protein EYR36_003214 [Pleurotus pulmonarius]